MHDTQNQTGMEYGIARHTRLEFDIERGGRIGSKVVSRHVTEPHDTTQQHVER